MLKKIAIIFINARYITNSNIRLESWLTEGGFLKKKYPLSPRFINPILKMHFSNSIPTKDRARPNAAY